MIELTHQKQLSGKVVQLRISAGKWEARFSTGFYRVGDLNARLVPVGCGAGPSDALADLAKQLASVPERRTFPQPGNSA